ncbi:MAG: septum formation initiator family protein [Peptoniphilaceae bacterium]|nr:septum formation initiator family protein [Peptoniphilaceae bacterium]MDY6019054.1 septum formation initiator family protein [Anaerococcus sp.]
MNKNQKYLRNRKKNNRKYLISLVILITIAFFGFKKMNQAIHEQISILNQQIKEKNSQIENVKVDIAGLKSDYEMRNSDEFKEKIARERLGMVKKDEYVYKDGNNK